MEAACALFDDSDDEEDSVFVTAIVQPGKEKQRCGPATPSECEEEQIQRLRQESSIRCTPELWCDCAPLYMGPCEYTSSLSGIGGARGFIAAQDIAPGELLLSEIPIVPWPDNNLDEPIGIALVRTIMGRADADFVLTQLEHLHPISLQYESVAVKEDMIARHASGIEELLAKYSGLTKESILRVLLACRYNMYRHGLFLHFSIFNHSAFPNCLLDTRSSPNPEIRATRIIKRGEPLTVSYLVSGMNRYAGWYN
jgi:hypothetical protein